jgi:anthranilate synthase component I
MLFKKTTLTMTELKFNQLAAQGYNRIPLISQAFADLETPLSLYLKLTHNGVSDAPHSPHSFLLESVVLKPRWSRTARWWR